MALELNANRRIGLALFWLALLAVAGFWLICMPWRLN